MALAFDNTLVREPGLLVPRRQPVGRVRVNWDHPLTDGLWLFAIPQHRGVVDVARERLLQGGWRVVPGTGRYGRWYKGNAYDSDSAASVPTGVPPVGDWSGVTCLAISENSIPVGSTQYPGYCMSVTPGGYYGNYLLNISMTQGIIQFRAGNSATPIDSAPGLSVGDIIFHCGTWDKAFLRQYYSLNLSDIFDETPVAQSTDFLGSAATENDLLYYSRTPGRAYPGPIYLQAIWGRALARAEVESIHRDPYQFLIPAG